MSGKRPDFMRVDLSIHLTVNDHSQFGPQEKEFSFSGGTSGGEEHPDERLLRCLESATAEIIASVELIRDRRKLIQEFDLSEA